MSRKYDPKKQPLTASRILAWLKKHPKTRYFPRSFRSCPIAKITGHYVSCGAVYERATTRGKDHSLLPKPYDSDTLLSKRLRMLSSFEKMVVDRVDRSDLQQLTNEDVRNIVLEAKKECE